MAFEAMQKLTGRADFRPFEVVEFMVGRATRHQPGVIRSRIAGSALRRGVLVRSAPGVYRLASLGDVPYQEPPLAKSAPTPRCWTAAEVKRRVAEHLLSNGWSVIEGASGTREIGIDARKHQQRLLVTPVGSGVRGPEQRRLFATALGEVVIHQAEVPTVNALALPLEPQYEALVDRLSDHARRQLNLHVMWIRPGGSVEWRNWQGTSPGFT